MAVWLRADSPPLPRTGLLPLESSASQGHQLGSGRPLQVPPSCGAQQQQPSPACQRLSFCVPASRPACLPRGLRSPSRLGLASGSLPGEASAALITLERSWQSRHSRQAALIWQLLVTTRENSRFPRSASGGPRQAASLPLPIQSAYREVYK